jgi:hypothetical protein
MMNHLKRKAPRHLGTLSILVVNIFWRVWEENTSTFGVRYSTFDIKKTPNIECRISNVEVNTIPLTLYPIPFTLFRYTADRVAVGAIIVGREGTTIIEV